MITHDHAQNSPEWFAARLGLPTASRASDLVTSTAAPSKSVDRYAEELAIEAYTGKPANTFKGNSDTEFGHEMESVSADWYAFETGSEISETGFITDDLKRFGCSPDRFVVGSNGLVELKNLPKQHVKALLYWQKHNKPPTDYLAQCHMQMLVTDREWCDLVYYSKDLPRLIIRIDRDSKFDDALKQQITVCIEKRDEVVSILEKFDRPLEAA